MKLAIVQYSSNFGGSTLSGQMIASGMLGHDWDVQMCFGFDGPFVASMQEANCSTHVVPHNNWLRTPGILHFIRNFLAELHASADFESEFRRLKPDVVYVNTIVSYAAVKAASRLGIPVVWHIREMFSDEHGEMSWPANYLKGPIRKHMAKLATKIVVNSSAVAANVFGSSDNYEVENIPNAVFHDFFKSRGNKVDCQNNLMLPNGVPLVGLPGTLRPVKGHSIFLKAIPLIIDEIPNCHFAITGAIDSDFARSLVETAELAPYAGRVIFTGEINDMLSFYHACDVCCVPSISEPFGRTAVECFATRTPLVATAVGGLNDIVRHDDNALVVPVADENALAKSIVSLLQDNSHAKDMVDQAFADAEKYYTEDVYVKRIAAVIDQAIAGD
ncbi:glycosyltransferase family 4 protein [Akkermansiaceae bacterium]|nr:glycosyltransferase family 4 protein [Akkermansiaceae bacterium]